MEQPPASPPTIPHRLEFKEHDRHEFGLWHLILPLHALALLICLMVAPFVRRILLPDHAGPDYVWESIEHRAADQKGGPRDSVQAGYWIFYTFGILLGATIIVSAVMTCTSDEFVEPDVDLDLRSASDEIAAIRFGRLEPSSSEGSHLRFRSLTSGTMEAASHVGTDEKSGMENYALGGILKRPSQQNLHRV